MGYFYLAVIKAGGYLGAAYVLTRIYHNDAHLRMWVVTLTRLLLGLTVGLAYGGLSKSQSMTSHSAMRMGNRSHR